MSASQSHRDDDHLKTPHFFKVILQETIRDGILWIPRKFVGKYGHQLSGTVKLEVPTGAIWQVELAKTDGRMLLEKGWREFAEYYSLEFGSFLVFRYKGKGHFHVLIFDKSASEIEYPYTTRKVDVRGKITEKSHLLCPLPRKRTRTDSPSQPVTNSKSEVLPAGNSIAHSNSSRINHGNLQKVEKPVGQLDAQRSVKTMAFSYVQLGLTATEKAHVVQVASAFESTGNPVFVAVMKPSYVCYKQIMCIPGGFARKFLPMHSCDLTLVNSAAKKWPVKYCYNAEYKIPQGKLCGGWQAFVEDNHLRAGDTCVFELIKHSEIIIKVIINPVVENASKAYRPQALGSIAGRVKTRNLVGDTKPNSQQSSPPADSYIEVLNDSLLTQKTKKNLASSSFEHCKVMRTKPSGSTQAEGFRLKREKKSMNNQYLTKEFDGEIKWSAKDDSGRMSGSQRCMKPELIGKIKMETLTPTKKQKDYIEATGFRTSNPFFSIAMQPSYVLSCTPPNIPEEFAKGYLQKNGEVILRVPDGRTWTFDCKTIPTGGRQSTNFCCNDWRKFVIDNKLEVGDVCIFELVKENGNLLDVFIHRKLLRIEID